MPARMAVGVALDSAPEGVEIELDKQPSGAAILAVGWFVVLALGLLISGNLTRNLEGPQQALGVLKRLS